MPSVGIVELFQIGAQGGCRQFRLFDGDDRGSPFGQDGGAGANSGPQLEKMFESLQSEQLRCHGGQDFICHQVGIAGIAAEGRIGGEVIPLRLHAVTPIAYKQLQGGFISLVEKEDVHRQVQLQVGWIVVFAVQDKYTLGRLTQMIDGTTHGERHVVDGWRSRLERRDLVFRSLLAVSIVPETSKQF